MKYHIWRQFVCFVLGLAAMVPAKTQQGNVPEFRGEIRKSGASFYHGFLVRLDSIGSQGEPLQTEVQSDGSFRLRNVPAGEYRLSLTNYEGDMIQQDFITVSQQTPTVTVLLADSNSPRPPDGSVSLGRLQHPPAPKAIKAFTAAQKLSESGKFEEAASKLQDAIRISPEFSEAWTNLAVQHMRLRLYDQAISDATAALKFAGPNSIDFCNLALAQWASLQYGPALQSALRGAELDPSSAKAQYLLGALLAQEKRWNEAIPHLEYAARTMVVARQVLDHAPAPLRHSFAP